MQTEKVATTPKAGVSLKRRKAGVALEKTSAGARLKKPSTGSIIKGIPLSSETQKTKAPSRLMKLLRSYPVEDFPKQLDLGTIEEFLTGNAKVN